MGRRPKKLYGGGINQMPGTQMVADVSTA